MSEWFQKAFGEHYIQLYSHRDSAEATQAVKLILEHCDVPVGAQVLDAPCGAGRHVRAFRERGIKAFGFDLSWALLREGLTSGTLPDWVVRADLRAMPYRTAQFDLLVNLFSSFGYFDTDEMDMEVLSDLVSLVKPGGWFVMDFMNDDHVRKHLKRESHWVTSTGLQVQDFRTIEGKPPRVNKKTIVTFPDGRELELRESVRLFSPDELRAALLQVKVRIEKEFGGYAGEPLNAESSRVILMGLRP